MMSFLISFLPTRYHQRLATHLLFLIALTSACISCQQDHEIAVPTDPDPPVPPPKVSLVKTTTVEEEKTVYSYDQLNRVILSEYSEGYSIYTYAHGYFLLSHFNTDSILQYFTTMELNADSLVSRRTVSTNASYTEWFEYNHEGQILKTISTNGADEYIGVNSYSNGNLDSTTYYKNGQWRYTYIYTYYPDLPNTLTNKAYGQKYEGNESKNLMKHWYGRKPSGEIYIQASFTYTFDAKDRVATQTQILNDNISTFSYTYVE